jgi:hypothetical protein
MKDSRQVRSEYQSFVDAYGKIAEASVQPEEDRKRLTKGNPEGTPREPLGGDRRPMVKVRKEGAFTEQAEKYQMSVKQFARFVEANQLLFSVDTRKKAQVANAFQGFKESAEWDDFFGDTVMEYADGGGQIGPGSVMAGPRAAEFVEKLPGRLKGAAKKFKKALKSINPGMSVNSDGSLTVDSLQWDEKEINDLILEVTTKETKSGTKYKVRVKHKDSGSSYVRYATREMIAQLRNDPKIASVEMTDEGDAPEDKGEKKALAKGGGDLKKSDEKEDTKRAAASGSGFAGKVKKRSVTTEAKKLDPVGKEDEDIDNDGDVDSSDKYLHKRRKAIGKAMMKKESHLSDWRQDLSEVMSDEDKKKTGKVKNKVEIMPQCEEKEEKEEKEECPKCKGKGCEHCDGKGYHTEAVGGSVKMKPGSGLGGGVPGYPRGQEPKKTGAKLPPLQKAGYEPEGEMVSEGERAGLGGNRGLAQGGWRTRARGDETSTIQKKIDAQRDDENARGARGREFTKPAQLNQLKRTQPTNMRNSFEPEGEQLDEFLGAGAQQAVDKATRGIQGGLEKMGVKINRTKRPTVTRDQQQKNIQQNNSFEPEGETLEEGPAALAIRAGLAAGTAIAGTKIGQEAINKVKGMVQRKKEREQPYMDLLNKGRGQ